MLEWAAPCAAPRSSSSGSSPRAPPPARAARSTRRPTTRGPPPSGATTAATRAGSTGRPSPRSRATNVGRLEVAWTYHHGDISDGSDGTTRTVLQRDAAHRRRHALLLHRQEPRDRARRRDRRRALGLRPEAARDEAPGPLPAGVSRRRLLGGAGRRRARGALRAAHPHRHDRLGAHRARRRNGRALRRLRRDGPRRAARGHRRGRAGLGVLPDLAARHGARPRGGRRAGRRQPARRRAGGRRARLRRAQRDAALGVGPGAAGPRASSRASATTAARPNVWSFLSADPARDLVFVPTGNPSPDLYGGAAPRPRLLREHVVALRASTGEVVWHFQTVHHDLWDYDVPAQPTLFEIDVGGRRVAGVAQITKMGHLFLLDRETGAPLYPVEERPVPAGRRPRRDARRRRSPSRPTRRRSTRRRSSPGDAWGFTPWDRGKCARDARAAPQRRASSRRRASRARSSFPSNAGGPNWGGVSIDPARGRLFVNQMRDRAVREAAAARGVRRARRRKQAQLSRRALADGRHALRGAARRCSRRSARPATRRRGASSGRRPRERQGALGVAPRHDPRPGALPDVAAPRRAEPRRLPRDGGRPRSSSARRRTSILRAFDAETGEEIWSARLPYTANATPMSYRLRPDGRQFVVVASGGHGWSEPGDAVMAFALPE